jgi:two-component sensor histidine kinase
MQQRSDDPLDVVTALGIVVAELLTNCYDHAYPAGRGSINVSLRNDPEDDGMVILTIRDNGKGFTPVAKSKRQGIGLVFRLIEQIRGTVVVESDQGTAWIIRFPAVDAGANGLARISHTDE